MSREPERVVVVNKARSTVLGDRVLTADSWWKRLRGFLGRPPPREGEGLLLVPSRGIHMYGMKVSLDVLILDRERRVIAMYPALAPGTRTAVHDDAHYALELPAGTIDRSGTEEGDLLEWAAASREAAAKGPAERGRRHRMRTSSKRGSVRGPWDRHRSVL